MATGLLRPDAGSVEVLGHDVWADPVGAKRLVGVLPDGLRLFDRLTGTQLVTYAGLLRGMERAVVAARTAELLAALGLADAGGKLVVDYSAGMTKKVALACALVHAPRLLVLDEPFEAVDPVSAAHDPPDPRRLRRVRRHGDPVQPRHGPRRAASATTWRSSPRARARRRDRRRGPRRREPGGAVRRPRRGPHRGGEGLAWLRTSSD